MDALVVNIVVQIERVDGQRRIAHIIRVDGYDTRKDQFITSTLYPPPAGHNGVCKGTETLRPEA
jgi:hypothetical protein